MSTGTSGRDGSCRPRGGFGLAFVSCEAAARALSAARQVARLAALDGTPKARSAREAGIDRMTLLKDLGAR